MTVGILLVTHEGIGTALRGVGRGLLVLAFDAQLHLRALAGGQQHHAHDALRVDLAALRGERAVAAELRQRLHELGGRACMQAEAV